MRIVMMGTGGYAVPTFEALLESSHDVTALVTKALPSGKRPPPNPMRTVAEARGVPILDPVDVNDPAAHPSLVALQPELFVVCDYGRILSPQVLALAPHGGINLHASLLPKYRGAAPINWALYHGETVTGNTVLHMTPRVDGGPCVAQNRVDIGPEENAVELEQRLARLGAPLVLQVVEAIAAGHLEPIEQDRASVTRAPRLKKSDGDIDWTRTAEQIFNQIRALKPWPGTFTHWHREGAEPLRLSVPAAQVVSGEAISGTAGAAPGQILEVGERLLVATGDGVLALVELQPAGKRVLSTAEFLNGYRVQAGDRFGPA
ncbi:MAG: methionyl-tRNA formyltransferase [Planctomycetota bacterium]|nr:MAG: methionyl-tRNA formyltransferase [Planctomycetota bacterium]REK48806.1 MAG: methionyl-tRNA formyltransferase [Planctomycetota bacterium]